MNAFPAILLVILSGLCSGLQFTQQPVITDQDSQLTIAFAVDVPCPVTVEVTNNNNVVIRHIGSGVLGANAPLPFAKNSLSQSLVWDKKDDLGDTVTGAWDIKVGLGLAAAYDRSWGSDDRDVGCGGRAEGIEGVSSGDVVVKYYNSMVMFDSTGAYVRTLIPYPGDLPEDQLRGFGRIRVPGGKNKPIVYCSVNGAVVSAFYSNLKRTGLFVTRQGQIVFNNFCMNNVGAGAYESGGYLGTRGAAKKRRIGCINLDGSCPQDSVWGPYMGLDLYNAFQSAVSPDGQYVYTIMDNSTTVRRALLASRDSMLVFIPGFTRTRGIYTDTTGNIYVSDSGAGQVKIYTAAGALIKSFPARAPDQIKVNGFTGEIYVMSLFPDSNRVMLTKYSALPNTDSLYGVVVSGWPSASNYPVNFGLVCAPGREPKIWLGLNNSANSHQITCFKDNGTGIALMTGRIIGGPVKYSLGKYLTYGGFLAVTPDETRAYTGYHNIAQLNLTTGALSTASGGCNEMTVSPDGYLYRYGNGCWGVCTDNTVYAAGPTAHSFKVETTMWMGGSASRGFDVGRNGDVYVSQLCRDHDTVYAGHDAMHVDVWSNSGVLKQDNLVVAGSNADGGPCAGGVQADPWGNIFMYHTARPKGVHYQDIFQGQLPNPETAHGTWDQSRCNYYLWGIGSILKFPPTGGSVHYTPGTPASSVPYGDCDGNNVPQLQVDGFHDRTFTVQGALWQYYGMGGTFGFKSVGEPCICTAHRFHVDGFGRVIVPESQRFTVVILDNNKNEMIRFGEYGNRDQESSGGNIHFQYPGYVWSVNRSVYVLNDGITRIKLSYPVEWSRNQGLITAREAPPPAAGRTAIDVYPQPANPGAAIRIALERTQPVEMGIYAPDGRVVRSFKPGLLNAGPQVLRWNGLSNMGDPVGSGLYVVRLKIGNRILSKNVLVIR